MPLVLLARTTDIRASRQQDMRSAREVVMREYLDD
jgi:hypothetical protein